MLNVYSPYSFTRSHLWSAPPRKPSGIGRIEKLDDSARGVLVAMLRSTGALTVSKARESMLGQQRMHLLDIFILDFCHRVNAALRGGTIPNSPILEIHAVDVSSAC